MYCILEISKDENENLVYGNYTHFASVDMDDADVVEDRNQALAFAQANEQAILDYFDGWLENPEYPCPLYVHFRYLERYTYDGSIVTKQTPLIILLGVLDTMDLQY
jgi:hypothetical protein